MAVTRFLHHAGELGVSVDVQEMVHTTHTAEDAAAALGCAVSAIVKSLLFGVSDGVVSGGVVSGGVVAGGPLLVLVSGSHRVDTQLLAEAVGAPVAMADATMVKTVTGYSIGGVPPFGHKTRLRTVMDRDLLDYEEVWAAAGAATAVFPIAPHYLAEVSGAELIRVAPSRPAPA